VTPHVSGSRRYLALWLPFLPTDRLRRRPGHGGTPANLPLVLVAREKSAMRIRHVDSQALKLGIAAGLTLADARARVPDLDVRDEDAAADAALLEHVADWCDRYTPLVGLRGLDGLTLDITGCAHLFGGEPALLADIGGRLERRGLGVRSALAGTPHAAHALARFSKGGVVPPGGENARVRPLPLAALDIGPHG
jgi:protein ImuB